MQGVIDFSRTNGISNNAHALLSVDSSPLCPAVQVSDGSTPSEIIPCSSQESSAARKRAVQVVSTKQKRRKIVQWMIKDEENKGKKGLMARAVREFPDDFRGSVNANITKASRWWASRSQITSKELGWLSISRTQAAAESNGSTNRRVLLKARPGRGRKRSLGVVWLYGELLPEFERLRAAGVKFSPALLRMLACNILHSSDHELYTAETAEHGKKIVQKITARWAQRFIQANNIVFRSQTGKLMVSPLRRAHIDKQVAYHLGVVSRELSSGAVDESLVENVDETHFVVNMDNGRTLGFRGDDNVKYSDVVSGGQGMTMVVRLTGGPRSTIECTFMIFQNDRSSYPIRGVPDDVPGVCYRSSKKGFMTKTVWAEWLSEPRAQYCSNQGDRQRHLWCDNVSSHGETPESTAAAFRSKVTVRKLVACATDLIQPADSFVISKIKDAWSARWDRYKMESSLSGNGFQDTGRSDGNNSGAIKNPGKSFFLKLAADSVREVNEQRDKNGLTYARKAMIQCGLALDTSGVWSVSQLKPDLQHIVRTYREHFDGLPVPHIGSEEIDSVSD